MEKIWRELRRWKVDPDIVEKLAPELRLRTYGIPDETVSPQAQAIAALFAFTVIEFSQDRPHGTGAVAQRMAKKYFDAAALCRSVANEAPPPSPEEKHALELAAACIDRWARWTLEKAENGPYFAGKKHVKLGTGLRSRFRTLTAATHAIYGKRMPHTVAVITYVALECPPIDDTTADSWSKGLLPASWVMGK
jgi:hypothetical protein